MKVLRILLIALIAQTVAAQQTRTATVEGIVVAIGTGEPVRKASVSLSRGQSNVPFPVPAYTVTTGPDGKFVFPAVQSGEYQLVSTRDGFIRTEYGQRGLNGRGTPI